MSTTRSRPSFVTSRRRRPVAGLSTVLVVLALLAAACGDSSDGLQDARERGQVGTGATTEEATDSSAPPAATANSFTITDDGVTWQGELFGVVAAEPSFLRTDAGSCWLAMGTITPLSLPDNDIVSRRVDTEPMTLTIDGQQVAATPARCHSQPAVDAGFAWPGFGAQVTVGTKYAFFTEFFIAEGSIDNPEAVESFQPNPEAKALDVEILPDMPDLPERAGDIPELSWAESDPGFTATGKFADTTWEGEVFGIVEGEADLGYPGRCFILVGIITPIDIPGGGTPEPFSMPRVSVVFDGAVAHEHLGSCDFEDSTADYEELFTAFVPEGTEFAFSVDLAVVGDEPATPQAVIVGELNSSNSLYLEPRLLDAVPQL